jgi:hypothetical protein
MPKLVQGSQVDQHCLQEKDGNQFKYLESSCKYPQAEMVDETPKSTGMKIF